MRATYSLPNQIVDRLRKESAKTGLAMSEIIRRAVEQYFRKGKETQ